MARYLFSSAHEQMVLNKRTGILLTEHFAQVERSFNTLAPFFGLERKLGLSILHNRR